MTWQTWQGRRVKDGENVGVDGAPKPRDCCHRSHTFSCSRSTLTVIAYRALWGAGASSEPLLARRWTLTAGLPSMLPGRLAAAQGSDGRECCAFFVFWVGVGQTSGQKRLPSTTTTMAN